MGTGELESRHLLFLVRMWPEDLGDGKVEWRGQLQSAAGGEVHYFRDLPTMVERLSSMLILPKQAVEVDGKREKP